MKSNQTVQKHKSLKWDLLLRGLANLLVIDIIVLKSNGTFNPQMLFQDSGFISTDLYPDY